VPVYSYLLTLILRVLKTYYSIKPCASNIIIIAGLVNE
jgi:hypothetical protein